MRKEHSLELDTFKPPERIRSSGRTPDVRRIRSQAISSDQIQRALNQQQEEEKKQEDEETPKLRPRVRSQRVSVQDLESLARAVKNEQEESKRSIGRSRSSKVITSATNEEKLSLSRSSERTPAKLNIEDSTLKRSSERITRKEKKEQPKQIVGEGEIEEIAEEDADERPKLSKSGPSTVGKREKSPSKVRSLGRSSPSPRVARQQQSHSLRKSGSDIYVTSKTKTSPLSSPRETSSRGTSPRNSSPRGTDGSPRRRTRKSTLKMRSYDDESEEEGSEEYDDEDLDEDIDALEVLTPPLSSSPALPPSKRDRKLSITDEGFFVPPAKEEKTSSPGLSKLPSIKLIDPGKSERMLFEAKPEKKEKKTKSIKKESAQLNSLNSCPFDIFDLSEDSDNEDEESDDEEIILSFFQKRR